MRCRVSAASIAALLLVAITANASATDAPAIPRFVSLKTEGANGRHGPGLEHRIDWIYRHAGLPLQVTGESGPWRRVRDPDGAEVWMHQRNLQDRRTALVRGDADVPLRANPRGDSTVRAYLAPGVIGSLTGCDGEWRRVAIGGRVGWVEAAALWGAEPACTSG